MRSLSWLLHVPDALLALLCARASQRSLQLSPLGPSFMEEGLGSWFVLCTIARSHSAVGDRETVEYVSFRNVQTKTPSPVTHSSDRDEELGARMAALRPALTRFFMRSVRDRADAEDMVQDVYLRIVRRGTLDSYAGFASYAFQTADSVLKDRNRRKIVRLFSQHVAFDPEVHGDDAPGLERELVARDELRSTSIALTQLPERTRSVFALRRLDGLSFAEISVRLGISVSAAEKHMLRATRHLMAATRDAP